MIWEWCQVGAGFFYNSWNVLYSFGMISVVPCAGLLCGVMWIGWNEATIPKELKIRNIFFRLMGRSEFCKPKLYDQTKQFLMDYLPIGSMYDIFTYIWLILMVNVSKYSIHGCYGNYIGFVLLSLSFMKFSRKTCWDISNLRSPNTHDLHKNSIGCFMLVTNISVNVGDLPSWQCLWMFVVDENPSWCWIQGISDREYNEYRGFFWEEE